MTVNTENTKETEKSYSFKPLEELTLMDDYMFGAVMREKKNLKPLLEFILNIRIADVNFVEPQKTEKEGYLSHAIRMDLYVEDLNGRIFNVEIQTSDKKNLPKRMRYYQSVIDIDILIPGNDYQNLKESYVIFICNYDPYKEDRYLYTFENRCVEDTGLAFGDGTAKVIVNTKGKVCKVRGELKELLKYLDEGTAPGEYTKQLDDAVREVKNSKERRHEYMVMKIREMELRDEGRREKTIEDARAMYDEGLDLELIARILKVSVTDVEVMLGLRKMA